MNRRIELIVAHDAVVLVDEQISQAVCFHFAAIGREHGEIQFDRPVMADGVHRAKDKFAVTQPSIPGAGDARFDFPIAVGIKEPIAGRSVRRPDSGDAPPPGFRFRLVPNRHVGVDEAWQIVHGLAREIAAVGLRPIDADRASSRVHMRVMPKRNGAAHAAACWRANSALYSAISSPNALEMLGRLCKEPR